MDDLIEDATEDVEVMALIGRLTVEKERLENRIHKLQKRLVYQDGYSFRTSASSWSVSTRP